MLTTFYFALLKYWHFVQDLIGARTELKSLTDKQSWNVFLFSGITHTFFVTRAFIVSLEPRLFHSRGLFAFPIIVFTVSVWFLLSTPFIFGLNCNPFSCHTVHLFACVWIQVLKAISPLLVNVLARLVSFLYYLPCGAWPQKVSSSGNSVTYLFTT